MYLHNMGKVSKIEEFLDIFKDAFIQKTFVKLTLSKINETEEG